MTTPNVEKRKSRSLNNVSLKEFRRKLRKNQTETEKILWRELRNKRFKGLKFFRQYSINSYILDFYCPQVALAIELDGGGHTQEQVKNADQVRDLYLQSKGIKLIRFWNHEVFQSLQTVLDKIDSELP